MRKLLLVTSAAVCVLGTPSFATTEVLHPQSLATSATIPIQYTQSSLVAQAATSATVVAQNSPNGNGNGNGNSQKCNDDGNGNHGFGNGNGNGNCNCDVVSPSKPCKGNNGFGNGGGDGSPNGKEDINR